MRTRLVCLVIVAGGCSASTVGEDLGSVDLSVADLSTADLAGVDLASTDLTSTDLASTDLATPTLSVGSSAIKQRINATGPSTGTLTTNPVTTSTGSTLLCSLARGIWSTAPDAPSDSHGNTYTVLGATHTYADYPTSKTGLYAKLSATGGANHTASMTWGDSGGSGDEVTLSCVETRGTSSIQDSAWVERAQANSLTSGTVQTTKPALLLAWWWGSGGVRTVGQSHVATPDSNFTLLPDATGLVSLSTNGYIQVAVAYRIVQTPGTYSVTWTTDNEGAQLYLVALQ